MKNKSTAIIIGTITILISLVVVFIQHNKAPVDSITTPDTVNTPTQAPTTNTPPVVSSDSYTLAKVATHNNTSSCWTIVNGSVYDVTAWISQHPGGQRAILGMCGVDGSSAFNGQHGGQKRPVSELASFKIGTLSK